VPTLSYNNLDFSLQVIAETSEWVCVNKPMSWLSVPSRDQNDRRPIVGLQLQQQLGQQLFPVHRLDYEVSGLLVFAKNKKIQAMLNAEFENQTAHKHYLAITTFPMKKVDFSLSAGKWVIETLSVDTLAENAGEFEWTCHLERGKRRAFEAPYGKKSVTRAVCLGKFEGGEWVSFSELANEPTHKNFQSFADLIRSRKSLVWKLQPMTGRSHQLRYEMFRHGCPILGDSLYGFPPQEQATHSNGIALCHFKIEMNTLGVLELVP
jgi:tRNA pseudouridine32 synthase/23S rRNA pseudouridine746 synthase